MAKSSRGLSAAGADRTFPTASRWPNPQIFFASARSCDHWTWGRAVAEARELARWGATDAAWRVLRDALPLWEAPGPSLIAPIGLLADPVLGPLVTPERGREIPRDTPGRGDRSRSRAGV